MIQCENLQFAYPEGPSFTFPSFRCEDNSSLLLLGESGTGKTTLLHLLAGLLKPISGKITLGETDIASLSDKALDHFRGQHIGIVFQTSHFVSSLNVEDNLILPHFLSGVPVNREKARQIIERLNLSHKLKGSVQNLSIGEQQRVAIARALVNDPVMILADEPTSALDDRNANEVMDLLEEQARLSEASLIIVTHDQRLKDRFSQKVVL